MACGSSMAMTYLPKAAVKGSSSLRVLGNVDYRLARNVVVSEYRKGHLSRLDICDAHPELLEPWAGTTERVRARLHELHNPKAPAR